MLDLLRQRRSIRKFKDIPIQAEKLTLLEEAIVRSPSSRNINPWEFIFVTDKNLLVQLSTAKEHGSAFLKNAALGIIVCGNEQESDVWIEDCSIASIIVQLTAQSLGLGSCWIQIRNRKYSVSKSSEEYIQNLLNIPKPVRIESIIAVGYPAEEKEGISKGNLDFHKIKVNKY
jgi:nitroreductase